MTNSTAPRDLATRIADTRRRLATDVDCWVATSGEHGGWLVPLSFVWHDGTVNMATGANSRVVLDVTTRRGVRLALGNTRDVVMIDGTTHTTPIADIAHDVLTAFQEKLSTDPRDWAGTLLVVQPTRIQAWREENEIEGRDLMRNRRWLD